LHQINECKRDDKCRVAKEKFVWLILKKLLMGVMFETKRRLMDQKRMNELIEVN
jgi:hypothetical protein